MDLETQIRRMEAENRFRQDSGDKFWTPENQEIYEALKEDPRGGEEAAEAFKQGVMAKEQAALSTVREQADLEALSQRWQSKGQDFTQEAHTVLPQHFPGVTQGEIEVALGMYRQEINQLESMAWQRAQAQGVSPAQFARTFAEKVGFSGDDFFAVAGDYLATRPGVIARKGSQDQVSEVERNRIKAQVEAAQREDLKKASQRHASNPNRNLSGVSIAPSTTPAEPESNVGRSMKDIKRGAHDRLRTLARERFGS